jgi:hypothetical protein
VVEHLPSKRKSLSSNLVAHVCVHTHTHTHTCTYTYTHTHTHTHTYTHTHIHTHTHTHTHKSSDKYIREPMENKALKAQRMDILRIEAETKKELNKI